MGHEGGLRELGNHEVYEARIERLHQKGLERGTLYEVEQDGVTLAHLVLKRKKFARLLARTVRRREHGFAPGRVRTIQRDKQRNVVTFGLMDTVVHGAIADVLEGVVRSHLSRRLFSYRRGVSWLDAVSDLAAYVRAHRDRYPDPRDRHLYVLCRDVRSYSDNIPVHDRAPVWSMLRDVLEADEGSRTHLEAYWPLVEEAVRPKLFVRNGVTERRSRGIPMGQPIACVVMNLYAGELDRTLEDIPGAFYARYSDDILFAHEDPEVVREADWRIDEVLASLSLEVNPSKRRELYLTGAGRRCDPWPACKGTTRVPYLGTMVFADGTIAMGKKRARRFLGEVERRAERTARSVRGADHEEVGRAVCAAVNRAIGTDSTPFRTPAALFLQRAATDRGQLAQLDYWIARTVVRVVTGHGDVRAFRDIPYRKVRRDWGLRSLVDMRNRLGRAES